MVQLFLYHQYYRAEITDIKRRLKEIKREIRLNKLQLSRLKSSSSPRDQEEEAHRRFASYLSTGSFQSIRHPKFRSDLVRKKRLLWSLAIIAALVLLAFLLHRY